MMFHFWRKAHSDESPTVRLLKAMTLGSKDIEINREGDISDLQKGYLHREFWVLTFFSGGFSVFIILGVGLQNVSRRPLLLAMPPVSVLIICLVLAALLYTIRQHYRNVAAGQAVAFTGRVRKHSTSKEWLLIVVNYDKRTEHIYDVDRAVYNAFLEGETYTIYAPSYWLKKIISGEHHPA